jgi:hypothetical protein
VTERELASNIETLCKYLGVRYYHTWNSRNSVAGFLDYVFLTVDGRVLWREIKTAKGKVSPDQQQWIDDLQRCGQDAAVWRPEDWPDRILRELSPVPASRGVA